LSCSNLRQSGTKTAVLRDFVRVEGGANLVDVGAVTADELVELVACDAERCGPVGDVGRHFRVDLLEVVRAIGGVVFFEGVSFVDFAIVAVLGHEGTSFFSSRGSMRRAHSSLRLV
jgi:hypothetical protein